MSPYIVLQLWMLFTLVGVFFIHIHSRHSCSATKSSSRWPNHLRSRESKREESKDSPEARTRQTPLPLPCHDITTASCCAQQVMRWSPRTVAASVGSHHHCTWVALHVQLQATPLPDPLAWPTKQKRKMLISTSELTGPTISFCHHLALALKTKIYIFKIWPDKSNTGPLNYWWITSIW